MAPFIRSRDFILLSRNRNLFIVRIWRQKSFDMDKAPAAWPALFCFASDARTEYDSLTMGKLKGSPVAAEDLAEFVGSNSDFRFAMSVLARLNNLGFNCSHSGTYRDPGSDRLRQFDIRAKHSSGNWHLAIAVETKNLQSYFPLLITAVPRTRDESFHDQILFNPREVTPWSGRRVMSVYKPGEMVGKRLDQVRRRRKGGNAKHASGEFISTDEMMLEKVHRVVNCCTDLIRQTALKRDTSFVQVVLPMLVIPTGTLWQVDYATDGSLQIPPRSVERSNYFLNHGCSVETGYLRHRFNYHLSHLEIVTVDALPQTIEGFLARDGMFPPK
jgi:hypothetical protein